MERGTDVEVRGVLEEDNYDHPVYQLTQDDEAVRGRVARINYARHGEINGFVLRDGTFIHLKPAGAKRYPVKVGDEMVVTGERRVGPAAMVIEATEVTRWPAKKRASKEARAEV